ncbi:LysR family transcriptional regulator [Nonomuraea phyllanthi]|uniref:LysR family transcriptional regulator n=1 Tax=Nonomuraea phyllanthi TaxID=2219224 RepID=UPI001293AD3B|nr:LysR family transcriptional regulator [Nonomuraea phyllanthi]QFY12042.1 LysR family transcriptional regulator [Nonomuraea phyllanthi]
MLNLIHLKVLAAVARHGSVTEAAKELHYSQSSVSHHLARLEADTGAKLIQRVGRGIRLTAEGRLLAVRAAEIVGRVDAAANELAAQVGLEAGRVRLAANASALSTIVPKAAVALDQAHPGLELILIDSHPVESLQMLRHGEIDLALIFQHADAPLEEEEGFRLVPLCDDRIYLVSRRPGDSIADHRHSAWIGGCLRCRNELVNVCGKEGFTPRIASLSDDIVVVQALVAAGRGVTTLPGLALQAHRHPGVHATELTGFSRQIHAVTYGDPPDPPAIAAVLKALAEATR